MIRCTSTSTIAIPVKRFSDNQGKPGVGTTGSNKQQTNKNETISLFGRSRAGDGSCFFIPDLSWMIDCGALITHRRPKVLLLTHTHSDHIFYLTRILLNESSLLTNKKELTIFLPANAVASVEEYINAFENLTDCWGARHEAGKQLLQEKGKEENKSYDNRQTKRLIECCTLRGLQANDEEICLNGNLFIRAIACHHRIPCIGYSVSRKRNQLKRQYATLSSQEIRSLKKQGEEITEEVKDRLFCHLGDTTHHVFEENPWILTQHSAIVVECSFFEPEDFPRAEETTHMHWNNLRPYVENHPEILFVLIHFSLKYSTLRIRNFFRHVRNVHPLLVEEEIKNEFDKAIAKGKIQGNESVPLCSCFICNPAHFALENAKL